MPGRSGARQQADRTDTPPRRSAGLLLIRRYTREPGVRNLERQLAMLSRKAVKELTLSRNKSVLVEAKNVADYIGVPSSATTTSRSGTTVASGDR
jgi:ATP-dependent Lon protease